eukprot:763103-Rhodomonas_salina.1
MPDGPWVPGTRGYPVPEGTRYPRVPGYLCTRVTCTAVRMGSVQVLYTALECNSATVGIGTILISHSGMTYYPGGSSQASMFPGTTPGGGALPTGMHST